MAKINNFALISLKAKFNSNITFDPTLYFPWEFLLGF